jgi:hypothetical protein
VEEPPDKNHGCHDEQTEGLVAAEGSTLLVALLVFSQLLEVRLDAAFDHACALFGGWNARRFITPQYRG